MTWRDVRSLELRDYNALVDQMVSDLEAQEAEQKRIGNGRRTGRPVGNGERRTPVMT